MVTERIGQANEEDEDGWDDVEAEETRNFTSRKAWTPRDRIEEAKQRARHRPRSNHQLLSSLAPPKGARTYEHTNGEARWRALHYTHKVAMESGSERRVR